MIDPLAAVQLLRAYPDKKLHEVADCICTLVAALGQAASTAGPRVQCVYETASQAVKK